MTFVAMSLLGLVLGWLVWNFAGEGGMALGTYLSLGVVGNLCGALCIGSLGDPFDGMLGALVAAPLCSLCTLSLVAFLDRRRA